MSVEAMKQALSALVNTGTHPMMSAEQYFKEMTAMEALQDAIEDAIEQAEKQEPVAWMTNAEQETTAEYMFSHVKTPVHDIPLYTALPKREWVGLTEDEITELFCDYDASQFPKFVRTVEANLREKNAYGSQPINDPSEWLD